ncbi:MAG TPA: YfbM family protein [Gaiellaceae bacterium]|nr:YfbM family protein [Gaiellaceae bacterium]
MNATFVQVEPGFLDDPSRIDSLFMPELPAAFDPENMRKAIMERGPQLMAAAMEMHPQLREQLEQSLGRSQAALANGDGGDAVFSLIQQRLGGRDRAAGGGDRLELDKAWHGLHYILSGKVEPDETLIGQAVLGGTEIGDDFSGYGPARWFTAAEVGELAAVLGDPAVAKDAAARYDTARMTELQIYPFGWDEDDREWLLSALRGLRGFYADAAGKGSAVVTCLV